jgi:excisionase family DNA binding protein
MKKNTPVERSARKPYTIKAAAAHLGICTKTVHRLIKDGVLRVSTVLPRKFLIPAEDVENLVESTSRV